MKYTCYQIEEEFKNGFKMNYIVYPLSPRELTRGGIYFSVADYQFNSQGFRNIFSAEHDGNPETLITVLAKYLETFRDACNNSLMIQPGMAIFPKQIKDCLITGQYEIKVKNHLDFPFAFAELAATIDKQYDCFRFSSKGI